MSASVTPELPRPSFITASRNSFFESSPACMPRDVDHCVTTAPGLMQRLARNSPRRISALALWTRCICSSSTSNCSAALVASAASRKCLTRARNCDALCAFGSTFERQARALSPALASDALSSARSREPPPSRSHESNCVHGAGHTRVSSLFCSSWQGCAYQVVSVHRGRIETDFAQVDTELAFDKLATPSRVPHRAGLLDKVFLTEDQQPKLHRKRRRRRCGKRFLVELQCLLEQLLCLLVKLASCRDRLYRRPLLLCVIARWWRWLVVYRCLWLEREFRLPWQRVELPFRRPLVFTCWRQDAYVCAARGPHQAVYSTGCPRSLQRAVGPRCDARAFGESVSPHILKEVSTYVSGETLYHGRTPRSARRA